MSTENMNIEEVEAEVVQEGEKAVTMDDVAKEGFTAGTSYEENESEEKAFTGNTSKTMSIISIILGALSFICCCTCWGGLATGIAAIILGIVSLKNEPTAKTLAIIGIVCGSLGSVVAIMGLIIAGIFNGASNIVDMMDNYINM